MPHSRYHTNKTYVLIDYDQSHRLNSLYTHYNHL